MREVRNFAEANRRLAMFYNNAPVKYTLDNMLRLMEFLGNPQDSYRVLHVAGTSGKTSTAYYAAALLTAAGYKTGLTVSPHVDEINERVQIAMVPLAEAEFCARLSEFLDLIESGSVNPSWFELMIAFTYWYFRESGVEYAVVEVGLGGLKDGTNVIHRPDKVCVITDIGLDHTRILGNTLSEIATQKAGIIHPGNEVFVYQQGEEVMGAIAAACRREQVRPHIVTFNGSKAGDDLPVFQQRNLQLAERAVAFMLDRDHQSGLTADQKQQAAHTYIPARMEVVELGGKTIIIDGAHNGQKLGVLIDSLHVKYPKASFAVLVAFVESDAQRLNGAIEALAGFADTFIVTSFVTAEDYLKRSIDPDIVAQQLQSKGLQANVIPDPTAAFRQLLTQSQDVLVVTGSFYLLNHIRPLIKRLT